MIVITSMIVFLADEDSQFISEYFRRQKGGDMIIAIISPLKFAMKIQITSTQNYTKFNEK